jgi:hypothetical protein
LREIKRLHGNVWFSGTSSAALGVFVRAPGAGVAGAPANRQEAYGLTPSTSTAATRSGSVTSGAITLGGSIRARTYFLFIRCRPPTPTADSWISPGWRAVVRELTRAQAGSPGGQAGRPSRI